MGGSPFVHLTSGAMQGDVKEHDPQTGEAADGFQGAVGGRDEGALRFTWRGGVLKIGR